MFQRLHSIFVVMLMVMTAACSAPGASVGSPEVQSTAAPPTISPVTPEITVDPTATVTPPSPATSDHIRFVLVSDGSQASYRVREQLAGRSFQSDAIGVTKAVTGTLVLDQNGALVRDQSKFTVDLRTLRSDESRRDNFIQRGTLETSRYPTAGFVPTEVRGLASPPPTSGEVTFQLVGDLTVHGVTRPATWEVTAHVAGQDLTGKATTSFTFEDFGMTVPSVFTVLSVVDTINLEIDFHMVRQP